MTNTIKNIKTNSFLSRAKKEKSLNIKNGQSRGNKVLNFLQELGKALQFPIAVLPFAAILNRFGALGITYSTDTSGNIINEAGYWISFIIQKPGAVVFDNLPLLFSIGVAFGLAKDHRGEVALVGAVFYLVLAVMTAEHGLPEMIYKNVLTFDSHNQVAEIVNGQPVLKEVYGTWSSLFYVKVMGADGKTVIGAAYVLNIGVLGGIVSGCLSATLYNKYKEIKLPTALTFFGGRRFVPMMALVVSIPTAFAFAIFWPWIQWALMKFGQAVADPTNPAVAIPGTAVYGILNRLLLPFGLHQILNTFFWFQLPINGEVVSPGSGIIANPGITQWVNGDINAFAKGIAGSGLFQTGFFPIMMGGIPAIALAMIFTAKKENRKQVSGFLGGVAAVSFISGITEPIEFTFAFISPLLLGIHAALTGIFIAITTAMHIQIGFGFSAGLIDLAVSFAQSWGFAQNNEGVYHITSNPLWIFALITLSGGVYFLIFSWVIKAKNIQTPGREDEYQGPIDAFADNKAVEQKSTTKIVSKNVKKEDKYDKMASNIIDAIGQNNFVSVDNCSTRLRLILKDNAKVNDAKIKASGAFGLKRLGKEALQIIVGSDVEHVANSIKNQLNLKVKK
ncbi:PTS system, N-acetylglucosamine-specific IIBC component [Williamsoniiplasma somnilux]|uniref:PTS system, N-acetylglucosamine-specific IIBC component n=1 Tax=Williamsoniiplasma somnilux TaxID=215578 RepID=A0A2K8NYN5_9MOLU|nr:PTS transporter subunit EIIC [Williamsoniiplasma somnilux]ATZ18907.1 PTS system, N-acetylglucosamine-specific IIBC component [Williamsoniiplasma somnilux]